jgi:dipeptidyl aminopeptidase/acylaminoacyl peptidase
MRRKFSHQAFSWPRRPSLWAWCALAALVLLAGCADGGAANSGGLYITSSPDGSEVLLNGGARGRTPLTVRELDPGEYEVVLRKDGFQDAQIIATVRARQISAVSGALSVARPPVTHRLAFFSNRDGAFDIWTSNEFGADAERWTAARWPHGPLYSVVSPDRRTFAFNVEAGFGAAATMLMSAPRTRLDNPEGGMRTLGSDIFRILQWSFDSSSLLLKNLVSQTIWVAALNGNINQVLIQDEPRGVLTAAFSPRSGYLAFVDYDRTYLIGLDGTRRQALAENGSEGNTFLRYAPDGQKLAFMRVQRPNTYNAGELWITNSDGSAAQRLSVGGSQDFDPVWSHDGRLMVFIHRENVESALADNDPSLLVSNIWMIDLATRTLRPLSQFHGKRVRQPSISTDDQRITFVSNESGFDEIWMADLRGTDPYPITHDKRTNLYPMWLW